LPHDPLDTARGVLRHTFGHTEFRGLQAGVIGKILAGRSALAVPAYRRGKSLCYQIPVYDAGKTPGLELRANPGGRASWAYLYRPPGAKNRHRYKLGEYSTKFGLAEASRRAAELRDKRTAGRGA
jgi:Arm DNA-binding domain